MNKFEIMIKVEGMALTAELPEVFRRFAEALPLIDEFFGGSEKQVFKADRLHNMVGGSYKYSKWMENTLKRCRLIEGDDYWKVEIDTDNPENAAISHRDGRRRPYHHYFTADAARKIVSLSDTDEGHALYAYIDAVAKAATPAIRKEFNRLLIEKDGRIKTLSTSLDESERDICLLSKQRRAPNVDTALVEANRARISATALQEHPVLVKKCELYANAMKSIGEATTNPDQIERILRGTRKALVLANEGEMFSTRWETWAD